MGRNRDHRAQEGRARGVTGRQKWKGTHIRESFLEETLRVLEAQQTDQRATRGQVTSG